jgi:hypothetical protein
MQIQLKQTEIIAALKQYISSQGISLAGKTVTISFTAGRKESGIIADLSIEEVSIPGFSDADTEGAAAPALHVVQSTASVEETKAEPAAPVEVPKTPTGLFSN